MKKLDFVKKYCEIVHYPEYLDKNNKYYLQYKPYWCSNDDIAGTFAARAVDGDSPEEAYDLMVEYFNKNRNSSVDSMVKMILINIGWAPDTDFVCESQFKDRYLKKEE